MKQIFIFCGIAAFAFSCSKGDSDGSTDPTTPPGTDITLPLTVQVTSGSYSASDGLENVPVTLNEGDAIGLYILRDGNPDATAVKLTLGSDGTWSASEELEHTEGNRYFACYPWQEQPGGAIHADAENDEAFFAEMISEWVPAADQSTPEKFAAAALMTATGKTIATDESATLVLQFTPRTALVGITFPQTVYKFTNTPSIPDYTVPASNIVFDGFTPSILDNEVYLYQVNPNSDSEIKGSYGDGETWTFAGADSEAGRLTLHAVGSGDTEKQHTLQVGDFFLADGNLLSKDTEAATVAAAPVVGIVYQIDPNRISDAEKEALGGKVHGQVISSQMLISSTQNPLKWCTYGGQGDRDESSIGLKPIPDLNSDHATNVKLADAAIDGYYYTTQILTQRADDLEKFYPLFCEIQNFATLAGGPVSGINATGWYLPAIGQWFDVIRGLGGYDMAVDSPDLSPFILDGIEYVDTFYWTYKDDVDIVPSLNKAMEKVAAERKYNYMINQTNTFWTSSLMSNTAAHTFSFNSKEVPPYTPDYWCLNVLTGPKHLHYYTRAMLCF